MVQIIIVVCLQEQKNEKDGHSHLFEELKSELSNECKRSHAWQSKAIDSLVRIGIVCLLKVKRVTLLQRAYFLIVFFVVVVDK